MRVRKKRVLRPPDRNNKIGSDRVRWSVGYEDHDGGKRTLDEVVIVMVMRGEPLSVDQIHRDRLELRKKYDKPVLNWKAQNIPAAQTADDLRSGEAAGALQRRNNKWTIVPEVLEMRSEDFAYIQQTFSLPASASVKKIEVIDPAKMTPEQVMKTLNVSRPRALELIAIAKGEDIDDVIEVDPGNPPD